MSVLVSDRTESKFEAITYSIELHDMLIDFMQHGFGVKSVDDYVRLRYAYGKDDRENFSKYRFMMQNFKNRVDQLAALITNNVRAANTIYPTNLHECEMRRDYQNTAIVNCEQLLKELQRIAEIFEVDLNLYSPYVKAIDREIGLIKKWRQRDKKMESYFRCKGAHYKLLSKQQRKNLIQLYEELFNKKISVISRKLIVSDASSLAA